MHQGRADKSGRSGAKIEPNSRAVNPAYTDQLGQALAKKQASAPMYQGRGYEAPMSGKTIHPSGSQGKHR